MDLRAERRMGPVLGVDGNHVEMGVHDEGLGIRIAAKHACDDASRPGTGSTKVVAIPTSSSFACTNRAARVSPSPIVAGSPVLTESIRISSLTKSTASSSTEVRILPP